jgi:molybdate transport system ATP-binding protein
MIDVDIEQRLGTFRLAVRFAAEVPIIGLFGRSGSGKSSVINAIAGITTPQRGFIRINGQTLFDATARIDVPVDKRRIGCVFQDPLLFPHLDVESNLLYGQRLQAPADRFIEERRIVELLGLGGLLDRKPRTLSGGEKQRVAIGRALLAQPRILLMDEPLASLDVPRKTEILDYIERLRDEIGIPIVYVSHSISEISRLADTIVVLSEGTCVAAGSFDEVMSRTDIERVTSRYEAESVLDTRVASHDRESELTTLAFDGGELIVPRIDAPEGRRVRARIRARDVSLSIAHPSRISILNVLPAEVAAIDDPGGPVVDVRLALGGSRLVARITRRSLRELQIRPGLRLYAMVKAVSFDRHSVGYTKPSGDR